MAHQDHKQNEPGSISCRNMLKRFFYMAWQDTKSVLSLQPVGSLFITLLSAAISFLIQWKIRGWQSMKTNLADTLLFAVAPAVAVLAIVFAANLIRAPFKLVRAKERQIDNLNAKVQQLEEQLNRPDRIVLFYDADNPQCELREEHIDQQAGSYDFTITHRVVLLRRALNTSH